MSENKILELLISLGLSTPDSIREFYPRVRDREDVRVLRCENSGVIILSRSDHISESYYAEKINLEYWSGQNRKQALLDCYEDDARRAQQFSSLIRNKRWLDIGTGLGGILDLLSPQATEVAAVEPQSAPHQEILRRNYRVYRNINEAENTHYDIVTLFHVFEHFPDPVQTLQTIVTKMVVGGRLIIEVPHANDFLIVFLELESFKRFTFWSEHLILHTRASLESFLRAAGFIDIQVMGYQRFPLANHLYWLAKGKPGGHKEWAFLLSEDLDRSYRLKLAQLDKTDTLISIAQK